MAIQTPPSSARMAKLETIDFSLLVSKNRAELLRLLALSEKDGFFYLDLQGWEQGGIIEDKKNVVSMMEEYFGRPVEEKMKDDRGSHLHGYKPPGTFTGFKEGSKDNYETLKVAYAELVEKSSKLPATVREQLPLFDSFIRRSHFVNKTLLSSLSEILNLSGNDRFEEHHRDDAPSNTTLVLLHYPQQSYEQGAGHNHHTDIGSLTLLFTEQWGLQLKAPGENEWDWVAPRDGHAIINVGDSLRFLSGQRFNSCLHRVIPVCGNEDRYSIAYFLRPENRLEFRDADGKPTTARAWHDGKYVMFAEPHEKQRLSSMLTGGMEKITQVAVA